ncbi:Hypothetical predicted protein, partial [Paramuricea clavata]
EVKCQTVLDIIAACKTSKAPGFDNISASLIKLTSEVIIHPLTHLINTCIRLGNIPIDWKSGQLTPIFKKGQEQNNMEKSCYRPVTVLVIFDTIFEKCLYQQLYEWFEEQLVRNQSAFRKHHGCDTSLLNLIENWKFNLD